MIVRRVFRRQGYYPFQVPGGVREVTVTSWGAGGALTDFGRRSTHPVTPGETLGVFVGGGNNVGTEWGPGFNGGGVGDVYETVYFPVTPQVPDGVLYFQTYGYGASDVRRGGLDLEHRIHVTGGQGGLGVTKTIADDDGEVLFGFYSGLASATVLRDRNWFTPGTGQGGPAPDPYPEVFYSTEVGAGYTGVSYPGAGGGGYEGTPSGGVYSVERPSGTFIYPTEGLLPATSDEGPFDGLADYTATEFEWRWYPSEDAPGRYPVWVWSRTDLPGSGVGQYGCNGRVELEWEGNRSGWHVGRIGFGSSRWTPA